jgi:aerobic carbon-monoxide dehydrogenase small subunit
VDGRDKPGHDVRERLLRESRRWIRPMTPLTLTVNGRAIEAAVEPRTSLADLLRDHLNLTGTHLGCEHGVCGACTLLIDGATARGCITYAVACHGARITTIEGLDEDEISRELRAAFTREHALQCGYCTPGMLIAARDLVQRLPEPDEKAIRIGLSGNLCRCTGYVGIVRAVRSVIAARRSRGVFAEPGGDQRTLGPVGSGHAREAAAGVPERITRPVEEPIVEVDVIPDFTPAVQFTQSFDVSHPPTKVFAFFGDIEAVAACLPGASLTAPPRPERIEGLIRVGLGPIAANFRGAARLERDPATLSGRIVGSGADRRSASSTQGEILFRVVPREGEAATRVQLTIGYSLKGMLAQVGRPALVRDVAQRLIAEFARNLDGRLSGDAPAGGVEESTKVDGLALMTTLVKAFARSLIDRALRRRR